MLSPELKSQLDQLDDHLLLAWTAIRFGTTEPIWEEISEEEYIRCNPFEGNPSWQNMLKELLSSETYKKVPLHEEGCGLLWQIEHFYDKPKGYLYYKKVGEKNVLIMGSDIYNYLHERQPSWLHDHITP